MNHKMRFRVLAVLVLVTLCILILPSVKGQDSLIPVSCGTILEAELFQAEQSHAYTIDLSAGDTLSLRAEPIGQLLALRMQVYDPRDVDMGWAGFSWGMGGDTIEVIVEMSATGTYTIRLRGREDAGSAIGAYTLYIGCTFRDGTVVSPGDVLDSTRPSETPTGTNVLPADFVGFHGLPPLSFADVVQIPALFDTPLAGVITPDSSEIIGYNLVGNVGDIVQLQIDRISGNLNMGLVVLSEHNDTVFQASLVTSSKLTTEFFLPVEGAYTLAVFKVDLLSIGVPEATVFQVILRLNP